MNKFWRMRLNGSIEELNQIKSRLKEFKASIKFLEETAQDKIDDSSDSFLSSDRGIDIEDSVTCLSDAEESLTKAIDSLGETIEYMQDARKV